MWFQIFILNKGLAFGDVDYETMLILLIYGKET